MSVSLADVKKVYPGGNAVIEHMDLEIEQGSFTVLVGPSGCGKTTVLRMIAGLEEVTGGKILISGRDMTFVDPGERGLSMVFQNYAVYPHMTVRRNIEFGLKNFKLEKAEIDQRIAEVLDVVGLAEYEHRKPGTLSGGQRQRVALARAISKRPEVFLMDEPLSNLDAKLRIEMRTELIQLHRRLGCTFIYVTHDQTEAMTMGTRIVAMYNGKVMQNSTPYEMYNQPCNVFVSQFIGDPGMNIVKNGKGYWGFRPRKASFKPVQDEHIVIPGRVVTREMLGGEMLYKLQTKSA